MTKLNQYVKRKRHILPSVDHTLAQTGDAKYFPKLDANSGFWQIEPSPESSLITTFMRYKFNQLPFKISSAQEYFQKTPEIMSGMEGVVGLVDDLLLAFERTKKEHHHHLVRVLQKLRSRSSLETKSLFLGHIVDRNGVLPDSEKTKAIVNTSQPM